MLACNRPLSPPVAVCLLLLSILATQSGAALAKLLFQRIGPFSTTMLRLLFAAALLLLFIRPWKRPFPRMAWKMILFFGLSIAGMNCCFYEAIARIPMGVAVGLEFSGPLLVALCSSRRVLDLISLGLAILGIGLLLPVHAAGNSDPWGVFFALCAAMGWACYILFGKRMGACGAVGDSVALGMTVAALVILPFGLWLDASSLLRVELFPLAAAVGLCSSALPFLLEMTALRNLPTGVFGILLSLEPAAAALSGFLFWNERLNMTQWFALSCIMLASILITLSACRQDRG